MEAATVLEITPETLRLRAQATRERADALREESLRLRAEAVQLEREADALADAERLRVEEAPTPRARAVLAGEIAAYLARCRKPKTSSEIAEHFAVSTGRAKQALDLLVEIEMVYRSGLKRGTRYRILRDGEEAPSEPRPFGERWHEHVRDVAVRLGTFTRAEIAAEIPEVSEPTVYRWLGKLVEDGILSVERIGNANLYAYEDRKVPEGRRTERRSYGDETVRRSGGAVVAGTGRSKVARSEVAEVIAIAKAAGAKIREAKHGYIVAVEGEVVASIPKTPSDHRSLRNAKARMSRNGVR